MKLLKMKNLVQLSVLALLSFAATAEANLKVVATTTDMGALVTAVGKDKVEVLSIAKGTQDPHQIDAKPSFMIKMRDSDLVVEQGIELETAWIGPLIQGSRNPKLARGTKGQLELGDKLDPIEVPTGAVSRAEGDVHPGGNPHFQLDPIRLGKAAILIAERMGELDGPNAEFYMTNAKAFQKNMEDKTKEWQARIKKTGIKEIVTYHKSFPYFFDRFGITPGPQLEPKPGIPPTASHTLDVIAAMKARGIKLVFIENIFDDSIGDKLRASIPGAHIEKVPVSVGGETGVDTNEELIERLVKAVRGRREMSDVLILFAAPVALAVLLVAIHAYLGLHVLEREVIFVDISLSQVAALGSAVSLLWVQDDEGGAAISLLFSLGFCLCAAFGLAALRKFEKALSQEALIGITYALASGGVILVMDRLPHGAEHLKEALIGNILFVTWAHVMQTACVYGVVGLVHYIWRKQFWAVSRGESTSFIWDLLFYFLFGVVITFSTHHAGVLVVFSILVIPATLATRFVRTVRSRLLLAWALGLIGILLAFGLSYKLDAPVGAGVVVTLGLAFFAILIGKGVLERIQAKT